MTHENNGAGQRSPGRTLSIYPSMEAATAGEKPINVSPVRAQSALDFLDRMLPGEAAILRDDCGRIVDIAESPTLAATDDDEAAAEFVWNLQHPPGSY